MGSKTAPNRHPVASPRVKARTRTYFQPPCPPLALVRLGISITTAHDGRHCHVLVPCRGSPAGPVAIPPITRSVIVSYGAPGPAATVPASSSPAGQPTAPIGNSSAHDDGSVAQCARSDRRGTGTATAIDHARMHAWSQRSAPDNGAVQHESDAARHHGAGAGAGPADRRRAGRARPCRGHACTRRGTRATGARTARGGWHEQGVAIGCCRLRRRPDMADLPISPSRAQSAGGCHMGALRCVCMPGRCTVAPIRRVRAPRASYRKGAS
jgi:hypothetical protein